MSTEEEKTEKDNLLNEKNENCKKERAPYLVVDYGEQLVSDIADVRDELHKEILSIIEKLHLLWEVIRTFMLFIITVIGGMTAAIILQVVFPRYLAEFCFTSCIGITIVVGFLTLNPLMEAVNNYNKHCFYTPSFIDCHCEVCSERGQRVKGEEPTDGVETGSNGEPGPEAPNQSETALSEGEIVDAEVVKSVIETLEGTNPTNVKN